MDKAVYRRGGVETIFLIMDFSRKLLDMATMSFV